MVYQIKLLKNPSEIIALYEFIKQFPLDYPDYAFWLEKCKRQLELGEKKAIYITDNQKIVGEVIFQKHVKDSLVLEIKNFRISPENSKKKLGSLLEKKIEEYGKSNNFKRIQLDTHKDNTEMIKFLTRKGYTLYGEETLYSPNQKEVIFIKDL